MCTCEEAPLGVHQLCVYMRGGRARYVSAPTHGALLRPPVATRTIGVNNEVGSHSGLRQEPLHHEVHLIGLRPGRLLGTRSERVREREALCTEVRRQRSEARKGQFGDV